MTLLFDKNISMSKQFLFALLSIRKVVFQYIYHGISAEMKQCAHIRNRAGICKRGDYILKDFGFLKKIDYYANVLSIRVNCSETLGVISF